MEYAYSNICILNIVQKNARPQARRPPAGLPAGRTTSFLCPTVALPRARPVAGAQGQAFL